jgi:ABC-type multidrug transport system fused ATPase/permease subunit
MFGLIKNILWYIVNSYYRFDSKDFGIFGEAQGLNHGAHPTDFAINWWLLCAIIVSGFYITKCAYLAYEDIRSDTTFLKTIKLFFNKIFSIEIFIYLLELAGTFILYLIGGWLIAIVALIIISSFIICPIPGIIYGIHYYKNIPASLSAKEKKLMKYKSKLQSINQKINKITSDINNLKD